MAKSVGSPSSSISSEAMNIISSEDTDSPMSGMEPPAPKMMRRKKFQDSWLSDPSFMPWLAKHEGKPLEAKCLVCNKTLQAIRYDLIRHSFSKAHLDRHFVDKWLQDPKLSMWLRKQEDRRAWCAVCEIHFDINCHKSVLLKHANSIHHKMNMPKNIEETAGTSSAVKVSNNEIKEAEIRYCLFAVEHNISFVTLQSLNKLNKIIGSKLPLLQSIKLGKTKIRAIIINVINKYLVLDIKAIVKEKYFSIIIDESTDIANIKHLSVLVRFINKDHLETHLLDLIGVKEATADNIFKCIMDSLNKFNLSISKIVGIGIDNASLMIECNNSLMTRFKDSNSEIVTFAYAESIKRLPYDDQFVEALNFLNPQVALNYSKHIGQIEIIIKKFPSKVVATKVIDQWFLLASRPSADEKEKLTTLDIVEFWSTIGNLKDQLDNLLYDEVAKLAFICLSLPHSNADMEKWFSMITSMRNKKRNKLNVHDMVRALTRIKLYLRSRHIDACSFQISDQMLQCFNSEMYNREQIPSKLNEILLAVKTEDCSSDSDIH